MAALKHAASSTWLTAMALAGGLLLADLSPGESPGPSPSGVAPATSPASPAEPAASAKPAGSAKGPSPQRAPVTPPAEWTFLLYFDADSNLETITMFNLEEIVDIGSTRDVNVVILADRSKKGSAGETPTDQLDSGYTARGVANLANWDGAKLLYAEKGKLKVLADWGETNMGDPATLERFAQEALTRFPAKKTGLIMSDHGIGWQGSCDDEGSGNDLLDTNELQSALAHITEKFGKFELIGFDASLMANIENFNAAAPYTQVLVASEELRPGKGWNYTPLLRLVEEKPKNSGMQLGAEAILAFEKSLAPTLANQGRWVSISIVDASKMPDLIKAMDQFAIALSQQLKRGGPDAWLHLARARFLSSDLGRGLQINRYDISLLAHYVANFFPNSDSAKSANKLKEQIHVTIPHHFHGRFRPGSHGLSVFFPQTAEDLNEVSWDISYKDLSFSQNCHWDELLAQFVAMAKSQPTQPLLRDIQTSSNIVGTDRELEVSCSLASSDVADTGLVVLDHLDSTPRVIGYMAVEPDSNQSLYSTVGSEWFAISNGEVTHPAPIFLWNDVDSLSPGEGFDADEEAFSFGEIPVLIQRRDRTDWITAYMVFALNFEDGNKGMGELVEIYSKGPNGARELQLFSGDKISFQRMQLNDNGQISGTVNETSDPLLVKDPNKLSLTNYELPAGRYSVGYVAKGFSGNNEILLIPISVTAE